MTVSSTERLKVSLIAGEDMTPLWILIGDVAWPRMLLESVTEMIVRRKEVMFSRSVFSEDSLLLHPSEELDDAHTYSPVRRKQTEDAFPQNRGRSSINNHMRLGPGEIQAPHRISVGRATLRKPVLLWSLKRYLLYHLIHHLSKTGPLTTLPYWVATGPVQILGAVSI